MVTASHCIEMMENILFLKLDELDTKRPWNGVTGYIA